MRQFYLTYRGEPEIVLQAVRQIPWGHNIALMTRVKDPEERSWYALQTLEDGWSRNVLNHR